MPRVATLRLFRLTEASPLTIRKNSRPMVPCSQSTRPAGRPLPRALCGSSGGPWPTRLRTTRSWKGRVHIAMGNERYSRPRSGGSAPGHKGVGTGPGPLRGPASAGANLPRYACPMPRWSILLAVPMGRTSRARSSRLRWAMLRPGPDGWLRPLCGQGARRVARVEAGRDQVGLRQGTGHRSGGRALAALIAF